MNMHAKPELFAPCFPDLEVNKPSIEIDADNVQFSFKIASYSIDCEIKAVLKEVAAISLIGITVVSTVFTVRSCSNDVDRQHAQALKHQLQFSASSEGAR